MKKQFRTFEEAKKFVNSQNLRSNRAWRTFDKSDKKPKDIPSDPSKVYAKEWTSWGDFLGTGTVQTQKRNYLSFEEAKKIVHSFNLKKKDEWESFVKKRKLPNNIPSNPQNTYRENWIRWGDWLGTGTVAQKDRKFRSFETARDYVHSFGLKSQREWIVFTKSNKLPNDIPVSPWRVYKNKGWKNFGDWIGTNVVAPQLRKFRSYNEAKKFVHTLGLKSTQEWRNYCGSGKKPDDIPAIAENFYKNKGWISMGDWLGSGNIATRYNYLQYKPWKEVKPIFQKLARDHNIKNKSDWENLIKKIELPPGIPKYPWTVYSKENVSRKIR